MVGTYEVKQGPDSVGQVTVERQGLYYRFSCRCTMTDTKMRRLTVTCNGKQEDLGTLVPMGNGFGLEKRIPVKRLGEGKPEFQMVSKGDGRKETFVPVYPEEPFSYIDQLQTAFLETREGTVGVRLEKESGAD